MSNTNRIIPRRIFRPLAATGMAWNKLAKNLSDLNKDIPWGVFRLIMAVSLVVPVLVFGFMELALPVHRKYWAFELSHWWPWEGAVIVDNTTSYVGLFAITLVLYLGWCLRRYISSQVSH